MFAGVELTARVENSVGLLEEDRGVVAERALVGDFFWVECGGVMRLAYLDVLSGEGVVGCVL